MHRVSGYNQPVLQLKDYQQKVTQLISIEGDFLPRTMPVDARCTTVWEDVCRWWSAAQKKSETTQPAFNPASGCDEEPQAPKRSFSSNMPSAPVNIVLDNSRHYDGFMNNYSQTTTTHVEGRGKAKNKDNEEGLGAKSRVALFLMALPAVFAAVKCLVEAKNDWYNDSKAAKGIADIKNRLDAWKAANGKLAEAGSQENSALREIDAQVAQDLPAFFKSLEDEVVGAEEIISQKLATDRLVMFSTLLAAATVGTFVFALIKNTNRLYKASGLLLATAVATVSYTWASGPKTGGIDGLDTIRAKGATGRLERWNAASDFGKAPAHVLKDFCYATTLPVQREPSDYDDFTQHGGSPSIQPSFRCGQVEITDKERENARTYNPSMGEGGYGAGVDFGKGEISGSESGNESS